MNRETFDRVLDELVTVCVEFELTNGAIRMIERKSFPAFYNTGCPLVTISCTRQPFRMMHSWRDVDDDKETLMYMTKLADFEDFRAKYPEDGELMLMACGLNTKENNDGEM